jgi:TolA-binding protein
MSGNRVEELESKVRKLEATIEGLTDELVETKERLNAIEDEAGVEPDVLEGRGVDRHQPIGAESSADAETAADEDTTVDKDTTADGEPTTESEDEDTTDSESGDDIIVA